MMAELDSSNVILLVLFTNPSSPRGSTPVGVDFYSRGGVRRDFLVLGYRVRLLLFFFGEENVDHLREAVRHILDFALEISGNKRAVDFEAELS